MRGANNRQKEKNTQEITPKSSSSQKTDYCIIAASAVLMLFYALQFFTMKVEMKPHPGVERIFDDIDSYQRNFPRQLSCKYSNSLSLETSQSLDTCKNYSERFFKGYIQEFKFYIPACFPALEESRKQNKDVENGTCPIVLKVHCELEPHVNLVRILTQYFTLCRAVYKKKSLEDYQRDSAKVFKLMLLPFTACNLCHFSRVSFSRISIVLLAISSLDVASRIVSSVTPHIMKLVLLLLGNGKEPFQWLV